MVHSPTCCMLLSFIIFQTCYGADLVGMLCAFCVGGCFNGVGSDIFVFFIIVITLIIFFYYSSIHHNNVDHFVGVACLCAFRNTRIRTQRRTQTPTNTDWWIRKSCEIRANCIFRLISHHALLCAHSLGLVYLSLSLSFSLMNPMQFKHKQGLSSM